MKVKFDYSNLRGRIKTMYKTETAFAGLVGMSTVSMSEKLNNKVGFSQQEMLKILNTLGLSKEDVGKYFFIKELKKT